MEHDAPETRRSVLSEKLLNGIVARVLLVSAINIFAISLVGLVVNSRLEARIDLQVSLALQSLRGTVIEPLMVAVSYPGNWPVFVPLVAVVALILWRWRSPEESFLLVGTLAIATAIAWLVSEWVGRVRPDGAVLWVYESLRSYAYPSRHVVTYVVFFGLLCYLAITRWHGGVLRSATVFISVLMVVLVGPSRVFLGAHWASDVVAGYALGGTFLGASIYLFTVWRPFPARKNGS